MKLTPMQRFELHSNLPGLLALVYFVVAMGVGLALGYPPLVGFVLGFVFLVAGCLLLLVLMLPLLLL